MDQSLRLTDSPFLQAIVRGLKDCIAAHGPIDGKFVPSAAKRIMGQLLKEEALQKLMPNDVMMMVQLLGARKSGFRTKHEVKLRKQCNKMAGKLRVLRKMLKKE
jgi:hypothetical protein